VTRARRAASLFGMCLFSSVTASADPVAPFRVDYHAPDGCTDAKGFARAVMARSRRARVGAGRDSTEIVVRVEQREVGFSGALHAAPPSGEPLDRKVRGDHCEDVVDALAFIAALMLDPDATSAPREPEPRPPAPASAPPPRSSFSAGGGLFLVPFHSAIPEAGLGYGAFLEGASSSVSLVATIERVPGGTVSRQSGSADFSLLSGAIELCPLRFPESGALELRPCAGAELGQVHAESHGVVLARKPNRLWLAASASGRAGWRFAPPFFAAGELGASFALVRQHYHFDSGESVFDTPALSGFARIGLGVSFP
jgi:hypothetical protein